MGRDRAHRLQDIADQSGLSLATIDRVLHDRPGVSARAVRAVEQAQLELDRQQTQLRLGARSILLDLVMQAPHRFTAAVQQALEAELASARPAVIRIRSDLREQGSAAGLVGRLDAIGGRGRACHGVLVKAPDQPDVAAAIDRLHARGIPVVTLVTDVHDCARVAYVGLDNTAAGRTAAYLTLRFLTPRGSEGALVGTVLVLLSRGDFLGERERATAFAGAVRAQAPGLRLVELSDADGLDERTAGLVARALAHERDVRAVYSVGGGNRAVVAQLRRAGVLDAVLIGHDLDADNLDLLRDGQIDAVLHHDLRADMRAALRQVLRYHRLLPGAPTSVPAGVQVITPYNVPARIAPS
ncbi:MAG: substrate-binding domain-containing protein [Intrasporangium sp.]|uniref:LacI family DNA-binding transcriptional regulator n=1 Tax=Intrasporangium sp. TaxID=1925024 RepID=UPI002647AADD|nr:LacI family DNA-binding transcriptional regulator [Intrasporangium sp.]MDN5797481.1 substrate-binding domain-containing protein [Intrasporangium sp.]